MKNTHNSANPLIHVTRPSLPPLDDLIPYLKEIWESRVLTNGGKFHQELEATLTDFLQVNNISLFNNGTIALITALQALRINGEVITTPYSFVATSHALLWNGIKPVFVDIDPLTLNINPTKIEEAITHKTTAILGVHCYGRPCDVEAIQQIADIYNLRVIYDAAHAFAVQCRCGSVLRHGDLSVLSFHATKVFNTFEGGAIVSKNELTKRRIDYLKNFGIADETTVVAPGINGKMSEFNALVGLLQLNRINHSIEARRKVWDVYINRLSGIKGIRCVSADWKQGNNFGYFPILFTEEFPKNRDFVFFKLREHGVIARRYFFPLITDMPMYRGLESAHPTNLPVARETAEQVLCLPIYEGLDTLSQNFICEVIESFSLSEK